MLMIQVRSKDWEARSKSNYNPYHGCSNHKDCHDVDMNMVCSASKCGCRKDMAWNDEVQECQIFVVSTHVLIKFEIDLKR